MASAVRRVVAATWVLSALVLPATALCPPARPGLGKLSRGRAAPWQPRQLSIARQAAVELDRGGVESSVSYNATGIAGAVTTVYKFLRPHTIRGTVLASVTGVARALSEVSTSHITWSLVPNSVMGMLALLLGNAFIVGINQIYDVEIDKVNKPFLPVAAGQLSQRRAWALVLFSGICGPLIVYNLFSPIIFKLYMFGTVIGALYSVPPFRFKSNPFAAGLTIACVRGFLLNFGVYYAAREALGLGFAWNPSVTFLARFMTIFALVIAVTKDLPDVEGDKKYAIETFSTKLGVKKIASAATLVLFLNYLGAIATALLAAPGTFRCGVMVPAHALLATWLLKSFREMNPDKMTDIKKYYKRIWDLFYLEYILYPFI